MSNSNSPISCSNNSTSALFIGKVYTNIVPDYTICCNKLQIIIQTATIFCFAK